MNTKFYLLVVWQEVAPKLFGPYASYGSMRRKSKADCPSGSWPRKCYLLDESNITFRQSECVRFLRRGSKSLVGNSRVINFMNTARAALAEVGPPREMVSGTVPLRMLADPLNL